MAKLKDYDMEQVEELCDLGKALSSPVRIDILRLLYDRSLIIGEIAKEMDLPASSTAFHLKILEQAGLVRMEEQPGTRGTTKLCTRKIDYVSINLVKKDTDVNEIFSAEMPVGAYSSCKVSPTCGLCGMDGVIGNEDMDYCFFYPERFKAGLLWSSSGYVEYKFANGVPKNRKASRVSVCMEICSEAPGYREDWKSDITLWINGVECGTWTCPGDFGARRGRLTPQVWPDGSTQYGMQMVWEVRKDGGYLNGKKVSDITVDELQLMNRAYVAVRIGNKEDAKYVGGFNVFGKGFGDYDQDIVLSMEY
ncbi:MAG: ArsR family transcriptional regulator [Clostridia bacterium]|nr:ArsR family transcriptional regulator [Clostridia bacterium]NCC42088.1 ArsR family transcriptional regulator [Clostridia bacterium]